MDPSLLVVAAIGEPQVAGGEEAEGCSDLGTGHAVVEAVAVVETDRQGGAAVPPRFRTEAEARASRARQRVPSIATSGSGRIIHILPANAPLYCLNNCPQDSLHAFPLGSLPQLFLWDN